jgi:hypothetical protein
MGGKAGGRGSFVRSITSIIYKAHKTLFRFGFCLSFFVACRRILQVEPVDGDDVIIWLSVFIHQRLWQQCHVSDFVLVALTAVSVICRVWTAVASPELSPGVA